MGGLYRYTLYCITIYIAVDFKTLPRQPIGKDNDAAIIVLDGTWAQAKSMLHQNSYLSQVKQVSLSLVCKCNV